MTIDEKRGYLDQYQECQRKIRCLTNELEKWEHIGQKVNSAIVIGGRRDAKNSKVERSAVNVVEITEKIKKEIAEATKKRDEIFQSLNDHCKRQRHREILTMRYIYGMSNSQIAKQIKKDYKSVSYKITAALKEYDV